MAEEKFGIENLQKVLSLGVALSTGIINDAKDGFNLNDVFKELPLLMQIPDLLKNKDAIVNEAKDLSLPEIETLVKSVEGVINNEQVTSVIEHGLSVIVSVVALVEDFKSKAAPVVNAPATSEPPTPAP